MSGLKRVLFVCIGNACRSQMAEGFARTYGSDILIPASAGLSPAGYVATDTIEAMEQKGINIRDHFPKTIKHLGKIQFDLVVNMSGMAVPKHLTGAADVRAWDVEDPVSLSYDDHCEIRDEIERLVMTRILELRRRESGSKFQGLGSGRG